MLKLLIGALGASLSFPAASAAATALHDGIVVASIVATTPSLSYHYVNDPYTICACAENVLGEPVVVSIELIETPEPAAIAMLGFGVVALVVRRRRPLQPAQA